VCLLRSLYATRIRELRATPGVVERFRVVADVQLGLVAIAQGLTVQEPAFERGEERFGHRGCRSNPQPSRWTAGCWPLGIADRAPRRCTDCPYRSSE
jgi:hypothetical protein